MEKFSSSVSKLFLMVMVLFMVHVDGLKVSFTVSKETRRVFSIEQFGFLVGGKLSMKVEHFKFETSTLAPGAVSRAGFIAVRADSENEVLNSLHQEIKEEYDEKNRTCPLDVVVSKFTFPFSTDKPTVENEEKIEEISATDEGLYEISFVNCGNLPVSFDFTSEMFNSGPNYLTAGETPTPTILFVFGCLFVVTLMIWVAYLRRHKVHTHKVHHIMTAFLVLKILAVFAQAIDYHYIKIYGSSMTWNLLFHTLRALRAIMFFMVIILVGTGWSLLKPALNDRERKFLLIVLPLQVIANIALVIADELPQGSTGFMRWRDVFQLVDLACCFAVAVPIFLHIQHLERQTSIDGKGQVNLSKLKQFRRFYLLVLVYVYFTRIIVFLLGNSVNYKRIYLQHIFRELAALLFYFVIGYSFRPTDRSAYLKVPEGDGDYRDETNGNGFAISEDDEDPFHEDYFFEDDHQSEFGLGNDIEMTRRQK